jgi:hypothetical protein
LASSSLSKNTEFRFCATSRLMHRNKQHQRGIRGMRAKMNVQCVGRNCSALDFRYRTESFTISAQQFLSVNPTKSLGEKGTGSQVPPLRPFPAAIHYGRVDKPFEKGFGEHRHIRSVRSLRIKIGRPRSHCGQDNTTCNAKPNRCNAYRKHTAPHWQLLRANLKQPDGRASPCSPRGLEQAIVPAQIEGVGSS